MIIPFSLDVSKAVCAGYLSAWVISNHAWWLCDCSSREPFSPARGAPRRQPWVQVVATAPPRPATEAVRAPPTLPRGGGHLRERSWGCPEARRGPLFCSLEPTTLFFQPRNRPSGMEHKRRQPREAPPAPVSQAGRPETRSIEKLRFPSAPPPP